MGNYIRENYRVTRGDNRSLDYSSHGLAGVFGVAEPYRPSGESEKNP